MRKESDKEKEAIINKWKKKDGPNPTSYRADESYDKTQSERLNVMRIIKDTKIPSFTGNFFFLLCNRCFNKANEVRTPSWSLYCRKKSSRHAIET